jgi:5,10-methylenetetrahydromethanopterin reductase
MRDVFVSLADLAAHSERLLLGTRVTDPYIRHPALTAVAIATLDEVSGGRAILGFGAGGSGFSQLGIRRERPALAVREAIELVRKLWAGGSVEYRGQTVTWESGEIEFACRSDIPIVIAARGPRLLQLSGECADGAIVASGASAEGIAWARGHIESGERKAGRAAGATELLHMTYIAISNDRNAARQAAKRGILGAVAGSHPNYDFLTANQLEVPEDLFNYLESGKRDPARIIELIPDSFVGKLAVAGTVGDCGDQLRELLAAGIDHPLLSPIAVEGRSELDVLRLFVEEILPTLRATAQ